MQTCTGCGAASADGVSFCPSCGRALSGSDAVTSDASILQSGSRPPRSGAFLPGALLAGRYRIVALLGRGGMGEVYRAEDLKLGESVALKFLAPSIEKDAVALARLHVEVRNARHVSHPNVCRVYDIGEVDGQHFLTMQYIDGEDLASLLRRIGNLSAKKALSTSQQICAGLAAAHDAGLLHRDLKPANIMLDGHGQVRITDFGLALSSKDASGQTELAGTPAYMAPEQFEKGETSVRSDIYALGIVLYEVFTGQSPYATGETPINWRKVHLESAPMAPSSVVPEIDPAVESAILACLEKDPAARPASARLVAEALPQPGTSRTDSDVGVGSSGSKAASGGRVSAQQLRRAQRRRMLVWPAVAIVLAVVALLAYLFVTRHRQIPFEHFSLERVTDSTNVKVTAISPDGKYVATVVPDSTGATSLWVHNIPTDSERPILQDPAFHYQDVTFSPDGNYIYFRIHALNADANIFMNRFDVYKVPILGGQPAAVLEDVDSPISFLSGGQRVCFYRQHPVSGSYMILSANIEGGDEQVLARGKLPYPSGVSCAPDGKRAVMSDKNDNVVTLDFASGVTEVLIPGAQEKNYWYQDFCWSPDGDGLFAVRGQKQPWALQLVFISTRSKKVTQLTNDLNRYWGITLTEDAKTIATTQVDNDVKFEELFLTDPTHVRSHGQQLSYWFRWLDNSRVLTSSELSELKVLNVLTDEFTAFNATKGYYFAGMVPCGADKLVAFGRTSDLKNEGIYSLRLDGSVTSQLTHGPHDGYPECTPDGKWLFYLDSGTEVAAIVKMPLSQGESPAARQTVAGELGRESYSYFSLSPDGKQLAVVDHGRKPQLKLFSTDTLQFTQAFPLPKDADLATFSADNKSIFYIRNSETDTSLWKQPLDAAAPSKVADFPGKTVWNLQSSPDGTRLGLTVDSPRSHAVLLHETR